MTVVCLWFVFVSVCGSCLCHFVVRVCVCLWSVVCLLLVFVSVCGL